MFDCTDFFFKNAVLKITNIANKTLSGWFANQLHVKKKFEGHLNNLRAIQLGEYARITQILAKYSQSRWFIG